MGPMAGDMHSELLANPIERCSLIRETGKSAEDVVQKSSYLRITRPTLGSVSGWRDVCGYQILMVFPIRSQEMVRLVFFLVIEF